MKGAEDGVDLSVIIVSWNTKDLLESCLRSLFASLEAERARIPAAEVWVVDNASEDGSPEMVRREFPQVRLIENRENVGFARANNQAIRECRGRWVCLLNSDTRVLPGAFTALTTALKADPRLGMVGPLFLNDDEATVQPSWSRFAGPVREFLGYHDRSDAPEALRGATTDPPFLPVPPPEALAALDSFPTGWLVGACLLTRREAVEQVGLLDEGYFMYCEETDWCCRFHRHGWGVRLVPAAQIVHVGGQSAKMVPQATRERLAASKVRFFRRNGRLWDFVLARVLAALYLRRFGAPHVNGQGT
jgi:hypothetical protein